MRFGLTIFLTDRSIGPAELALEAEARGYSSIFLPEHTHIPAGRLTPAPMGEPLPEQYWRTLDPFVALTAVAAVTERLRVGTGICLVAQRDAIVTAKEVASLDHLSGGRFVFGVGFGWNTEEMADHGVDHRRRRTVVREKVLAMRRLWEDDVATFEGEAVRFERAWAWPKPGRRLPVLIGGGGGPTLFAHVAEYGDGWIPIGGRGIKAGLPLLEKACEEHGRDPRELTIVPLGSIPEAGKLDYFASLGIEETVLTLPSGDRDEVLGVLDDYEKIIAPLRS